MGQANENENARGLNGQEEQHEPDHSGSGGCPGTREGIERLLMADGYRIALARDEPDGIESARRQRPDLILVSLAGVPREVIVSARRIREKAAIGEDVPVVVFCIDEIAQGDEVAIGENVHITRPDNFDQLRSLLARLLQRIPRAA